MIKRFDEDKEVKKKLTEIFWQTTSFISEDEKLREDLKYKYFEWYFEKKLPIFYYEEKEDILGYILGDLETSADFYLKAHPYYAHFEKLPDYSAHLHINCHPKAQGLGIGSKLLLYFEKFCMENGVQGIHLVTALDAKNVSFYLKNNYQKLTVLEWKQVSLLFLGKKLKVHCNIP